MVVFGSVFGFDWVDILVHFFAYSVDVEVGDVEELKFDH